ncbi:MAG TPA: chemotaxis protein CheA [Terracidiphilus sp.]|nr:chemotaxis protein CheA [Terracidiphilus sp.]
MKPLPPNPLLEQFLSEARDLLENTGKKLMQLEDAPDDQDILNELFRSVHTLKGNSGLFTFPEMTRVLHAGEDLLGMVRSGRSTYSRELADRLLDAMDYVGVLCGEIESTEKIDASRAAESQQMTEALRKLMPNLISSEDTALAAGSNSGSTNCAAPNADNPGFRPSPLGSIPEAVRLAALEQCRHGDQLHWITYRPQRECFFHGDDPLNSARQTPGLMWGRVLAREPLPSLAELDTYSCLLGFDLLTNAPRDELDQYYRYLPDQVEITAIRPSWLVNEQEEVNRSRKAPSTVNRTRSFSDDDEAAFNRILAAQRQILLLEDRPAWHAGRLRSIAEVLTNLSQAVGETSARIDIQAALEEALATGHNTLLMAWLDGHKDLLLETSLPMSPVANDGISTVHVESTADISFSPERDPSKVAADDGIKFGRRTEDAFNGPRSLKVDQTKIDRLMNLIGELVVEKNALPYLAQRAEVQFGTRELSREIKGQYSVINRIADEMQDAIMQVRMMAVSFVFQRFPRLVRDISRKLGKEVQLVLEGEQTEADKNIIESLADPLIHIVRNSLDHGLETPEVRRACGKPETGTLTIRAAQQADRVVIEIIDDGKGIDPSVIKRKAYERGLIDEAKLERIGDQEAINLIFAAGLSTAEVVSDLSGRGVGMDVVRSAVEKINGTVVIESELGKGTSIRISLPLSMAVTQVMVIESDGQLFGVPMDNVVETVRVPRSAIRAIKQSQTAVLRGRIVPLKALNTLLGIPSVPRLNSDDELAVLLVQTGSEFFGLMVDGFKETIGLIQKPLGGFLSGLSAYSGSALMGDGSVLMILNVREIV